MTQPRTHRTTTPSDHNLSIIGALAVLATLMIGVGMFFGGAFDADITGSVAPGAFCETP
jgi:hypothetical protein